METWRSQEEAAAFSPTIKGPQSHQQNGTESYENRGLGAPAGPRDLGDLGQRVQNSIRYLTSLRCTLETARRIQFRLCACYQDLIDKSEDLGAGSGQAEPVSASLPPLTSLGSPSPPWGPPLPLRSAISLTGQR